VTIIPQHPENEPACPRSGIAGGPIHPAHAMEVIIADRVYAVTPRNEDGDTTDPVLDRMATAASRQDGMKLYVTEGAPINPNYGYYYATAYFMCLTCGFILPAQIMPRS
jgi:hypothetical protein